MVSTSGALQRFTLLSHTHGDFERNPSNVFRSTSGGYALIRSHHGSKQSSDISYSSHTPISTLPGQTRSGFFPNVISEVNSCREGRIRHLDGTCITPRVQQNLFFFDFPKQPTIPPRVVPPFKIDHNILLIPIPEESLDLKHVRSPGPFSVVYVLNNNKRLSQYDIESLNYLPPEPTFQFISYKNKRQN